jgi:opacity protein-like surface antigen
MKHFLKPPAALCTVAVLSVVAAQAQETPFYIKGDLGGAWTEDTALKSFFGENTFGAKMKFDPGARLGFQGGYMVTDWFSAEAETGVTTSTIHSITGGPSSVDASLSTVPFLLNARFQIPCRMRVTPFFGGGLGFADMVLDADHMTFGTTRLHGTVSDAVFAYQAFAGLRFALNDRMGVSVEYHYLGTTDPEWRADFVVGGGSDRMKIGGIETHSFSIAFEYRF